MCSLRIAQSLFKAWRMQSLSQRLNGEMIQLALLRYSLVRLVWQNTEELISRPFAGLDKIRLLLPGCMRPKNLRNFLALVQLQLCLQLQQNTIGSVDVDVQICHFCVHKYLSGNKSL